MIKYIIAFLILIIALEGIYAGILKAQVGKLENDRLAYVKNEGIYQEQINRLEGVIDSKNHILEESNRKIAELLSEADKREQVAKQAQAQARVASKATVSYANQLLAYKSSDASICNAANTLWNEYLDKKGIGK